MPMLPAQRRKRNLSLSTRRPVQSSTELLSHRQSCQGKTWHGLLRLETSSEGPKTVRIHHLEHVLCLYCAHPILNVRYVPNKANHQVLPTTTHSLPQTGSCWLFPR